MSNYRIIIGDNDNKFIELLRIKLIELGHLVLDTYTSGSALLRKARMLNPDIVIVDVNLKGISGFEIGDILEGDGVCPCIVSFKGEALEYKINISRKKVKTYIKKPVNFNELEYILKHSLDEFDEFRKEEKKIEEKKIIYKAKKILINKYKMEENKAYNYIRKKSMDKGISMYKMSLMIIDLLKKK